MSVLSPRRGLTAIAAALLMSFAAALAFAADYPALSGRVVDDARILPATTVTALSDRLRAFEEKSSIQFVVATVAGLGGTDIESYANGLFRFWKLGDAKKNNGVLLLVAPNERKMRIEVGYGLEGALPDAVAKVIIATAITPRFKAKDYAGGVERGVDAVIEALSNDKSEWSQRAAKAPEDAFDGVAPALLFLLFLFIMIYLDRQARGRGRGRGSGGYYSSGAWSSSGGSSWGGSSWSGSSGGSDSFSGGGGSSGGGGASGDW